jgi:hypothetical protein
MVHEQGRIGYSTPRRSLTTSQVSSVRNRYHERRIHGRQKGPRQGLPIPLVLVGNGFCSGPPSYPFVGMGTRIYPLSLCPRYRIVGMLGIPLPDFSLGSH